MINALLCACVISSQPAMNTYPSEAQLRALAYIESRNNPKAIGRKGEISEYQITKTNWKKFSTLPFVASNRARSKQVAINIIHHNYNQMTRNFHPEGIINADLYSLWNWGYPKYHAVKWNLNRVPKKIRLKASQYARKVAEYERTK